MRTKGHCHRGHGPKRGTFREKVDGKAMMPKKPKKDKPSSDEKL